MNEASQKVQRPVVRRTGDRSLLLGSNHRDSAVRGGFLSPARRKKRTAERRADCAHLGRNLPPPLVEEAFPMRTLALVKGFDAHGVSGPFFFCQK